MFGKKKQAPPPPQYEEEYSEQQSEPLIEEVDPTYEPTDKEVREYALETLGMRLPEDENLLYLARQGLKAPIPPNWVPYQSRNGIYYKHNITQEKIIDHPTDIEYRKKYEQIKEKTARKNLKSIALKQNMGGLSTNPLANPLGLGAGLGGGLGGGLGVKNNSGIGNLSNLSGISGEDMTEPTIDEEVLREYEEDLKQFEKKQEKEWRNWEEENEQDHEKRMKKIKDEFEEERNRIEGKGSGKSQSKILEEEQRRLEEQIESVEESSLSEELRAYENEENHKLSEYQSVFEEDKALKISKLEREMEENYQEKVKIMEEKIRKQEQKKVKERQNRMKVLKEAKDAYEKPDHPEIMKLIKNSLEDNIADITTQYARKLKQKQEEMERQLTEMRRIMGVDKSQALLALANKKEKILSLSTMKLTAKRNKEMQALETESAEILEREKAKLKQKLTEENQSKIRQKKEQLEAQLQKCKQRMEVQFEEKYKKSLQQMYQKIAAERSAYENGMNKKMSDLRMEYIDKIVGKEKKENGRSTQVANRVLIQEREKQIHNKEQIIKGLTKQLEIQHKEWKAMIFDEEIGRLLANSDDQQTQVASFLKSKLVQYNLTYSSPDLAPFRQRLTDLQVRYKQDKKMLVTMLQAIQETSAYNISQMKRNMSGDAQNSSSNGLLIKKYNEDVRKMRENQDMINKFELQLKKVEHDSDPRQLDQLRQMASKLDYNTIGLKAQMEKISSAQPIDSVGLQEVNRQDKTQGKDAGVGSSSSCSMEQALRQHAQFLSNVKNQLNRKLYQVRYEYRY